MTATSTVRIDWVEHLRPWRDAGVLEASDVHVAACLARLADLGPDESDVVLAAALAARAPRHGHVCLDLTTAARSALIGSDPEEEPSPAGVDVLPWPTDLRRWQAAIAASALTAADGSAPLVLDGPLLYLERYRDLEARLADEVTRRARATAPSRPDGTTAALRQLALLDALLPGHGSAAQRVAALAGTTRLLSVIVGGPGTGKTSTVATLLAILLEGDPDIRVALAAPTGKAAARMGESIRAVAGRVRDIGPDHHSLAARMEATGVSTVHRLLGPRRDGRFRHGRSDPLPLDAVIVDESSMVSLPLMVDLFDAIEPTAKVVLVGDPGQLASVEAGSVLSDIAAPTLDSALSGAASPTGPLARSISVLSESHRFPSGSGIDRFAAAVRAGDADAAITVLSEAAHDGLGASDGVALAWQPQAADTPGGANSIRAVALEPAQRTVALCTIGDADGALASLAEVRVLCAHRKGPFGVAHWNRSIEQWMTGDGTPPRGFYLGRPVLVTANDPANGLFNGDLGVVIADGATRTIAFPHEGGPRLLFPSRLESVETVHAMTIHKSQGSEFDHVVVVLPPAESRLASRELLYTAVTRARRRVTLVGDEAALRAAIERRVVRASGLGARLWPTPGP